MGGSRLPTNGDKEATVTAVCQVADLTRMMTVRRFLATLGFNSPSNFSKALLLQFKSFS